MFSRICTGNSRRAFDGLYDVNVLSSLSHLAFILFLELTSFRIVQVSCWFDWPIPFIIGRLVHNGRALLKSLSSTWMICWVCQLPTVILVSVFFLLLWLDRRARSNVESFRRSVLMCRFLDHRFFSIIRIHFVYNTNACWDGSILFIEVIPLVLNIVEEERKHLSFSWGAICIIRLCTWEEYLLYQVERYSRLSVGHYEQRQEGWGGLTFVCIMMHVNVWIHIYRELQHRGDTHEDLFLFQQELAVTRLIFHPRNQPYELTTAFWTKWALQLTASWRRRHTMQCHRIQRTNLQDRKRIADLAFTTHAPTAKATSNVDLDFVLFLLDHPIES